MIKRQLLNRILERLFDKKVIIVLGPRQTGKTTLLKEIVLLSTNETLWWNGDETDIRQILRNPNSTLLKSLIGKHKLLIIDEAQRIENIGLCIKLIYDNIEGVKVIASGSSAFELANKINEPLTGRKWEYFLYPISYKEMVDHHGLIEENRLLQHRLLWRRGRLCDCSVAFRPVADRRLPDLRAYHDRPSQRPDARRTG